MNRKRNARNVVGFCVILILVLVMLYGGLRILESTVFHNDQDVAMPVASKTITRNGVDYFPRQDITVLMVLGIDELGPVTASEINSNDGLADLVMLVIFDEKNENIRILNLNRDTMVQMPVLGIGGRPAGTNYGQLALSHTYGVGFEDSCENTRKTVSDLLYGINIDYYISMNMDAISILNDAVDGVTVTVTDDFSAIDPSIGMGEVTLRGQQAVNFVRARKGLGDQLNISRIERHKTYFGGFVEALQEKLADSSGFAISLYEMASPYLVTDCSVNVLTGMMERYADYELVEIVSTEGENTKGEKYMEFYVDEEKLDALILRLFYAPKE